MNLPSIPSLKATAVAPHSAGLARATLSEALQTTVSFSDQLVASVNPAPCVAICNTCTCASDVLVGSSCNSGVCNDCIACSLCPTCLTPEPSPHHPELLDHSATWRYAKRGTVLQLQSQVRVAEALIVNSHIALCAKDSARRRRSRDTPMAVSRLPRHPLWMVL